MATQQILERDVKKQVTDFLDAERIPWWPMNAGDRFGSYTSKRTGKTKNWRIKGQQTGTADLLISPKIRPFGFDKRIPVFLWCELKAPGETQSDDQIRFELECRQRDHYYICIDDVQELIDWLAERV